MKFKLCLIIGLFIGVLSAQVYDVGETVSNTHQNIAFDICYGDYEYDELKLADFNGDLNGGVYTVLFIDMVASW